MSDPAIISCPADSWTKIATNVTSGQVHKMLKTPTYLQTYRDTGNSAPTDLTEAVPIFGSSITISASAGIDVYVQPIGKAGSVRVDI